MKVCIFHEEFDRDVSSGTIHAEYQWLELFNAFGVVEIAVINPQQLQLVPLGTQDKITVFDSLDDFLASHPDESMTYVEQGGTDFRSYDYSNTDWLIFGGTGGLPVADVGIPTLNNVALYPREAAAIVLAKVLCPLP